MIVNKHRRSYGDEKSFLLAYEWFKKDVFPFFLLLGLGGGIEMKA